MFIRVTNNATGRIMLLPMSDIKRVENYTSPDPDRTAKAVVSHVGHKSYQYEEGKSPDIRLVTEQELYRTFVDESVDEIEQQVLDLLP